MPYYAMEAFEYNQQDDTYTCPAHEVLVTNGRCYNKKLINGRKPYQVKHYKTKACKGCQLRSECSSNKLGRIIERTEYQQYITEGNERVNQNPNYYRTKQQIIEHQFGTLKQHWHFDYLLTKGKERVMGEVYLAFTTYNLSRLTLIYDFKTIRSKLNAHFNHFSTHINLFFQHQTLFIAFLSNFHPLNRKNQNPLLSPSN